MNDLIVKLIHSYNGYFYETAGVISGFFNDPEQAQGCAKKIKAAMGKVVSKAVEVCGSQLSISL